MGCSPTKTGVVEHVSPWSVVKSVRKTINSTPLADGRWRQGSRYIIGREVLCMRAAERGQRKEINQLCEPGGCQR